MKDWRQAAKAVYGAVTASLTAALTALIPFVSQGQTLADVPTHGWLLVALAALGAGGVTGSVVYGVRNAPPTPPPRRTTTG